MTERNFSIEIRGGWQGLKMKPVRVAEVRVKDGKRYRKWISLMGDDNADLMNSLSLWAQKGCPSAEELKASP